MSFEILIVLQLHTYRTVTDYPQVIENSQNLLSAVAFVFGDRKNQAIDLYTLSKSTQGRQFVHRTVRIPTV